ncbi:hypothetical protein TNCV_151621 [Trichonephila clavipes]|uniref:Uncharacterized protein n=1 Tax=Trichonephila clavipes TaxID=2585209 RepID=A0A8X6RDT9_TRICX|nr:hypothetical protein TNCV_151621 [Trichonephila clavipes]
MSNSDTFLTNKIGFVLPEKSEIPALVNSSQRAPLMAYILVIHSVKMFQDSVFVLMPSSLLNLYTFLISTRYITIGGTHHRRSHVVYQSASGSSHTKDGNDVDR